MILCFWIESAKFLSRAIYFPSKDQSTCCRLADFQTIGSINRCRSKLLGTKKQTPISGKLAICGRAQNNIQMMRTFVQLRHIAIENVELKRQVEAFRNQTEERFEIVFTVLDKLISDDEGLYKKIGFIDS